MNLTGDLVLFVLAICVSDSIGCTVDQTVGDGKLSFVNEVSATEIVYAGHAENLDCEAVNHCSITWYKNGIPFPWIPHGDIANRRPEEKGQSLRFKKTDFDDEGHYTCVLSNGEQSISRTIQLVVLNGSLPRKPCLLESTGGSCADQTAVVGDTVRFSCEFFVGKGQVEDSSVGWLRVDKNGNLERIEDTEARTERSSRDDSVVVLSLEIAGVKENSFGSWMAYVFNNGYQAEATVAVNPRPKGDGIGGTKKSLLGKIKTGHKKQEKCPEGVRGLRYRGLEA
ncbi:uncharacterized protein LOC110980981 [Acanthaster planci]|uniref:Soluble interferon alpha/beta receptor OPG204 n=1 Tax=Acanthaster planci TaxID=133434 RepID=A0A8B7YKJ8_ACAPL|nr:uncharacterized protein LOC110980981 [Acanthaster planci]